MNHRREHDDSGERHKRVYRPLRWHSSSAPGVTILVPSAITIAVPKTPHIRLLAVLARAEILARGELSATDTEWPRKQTERYDA
jgi:hypothetical protein